MNNINLTNKVNATLQNVEMPNEVRELLIELRDQIPFAETAEQKQELYLRWLEIVLTTVQIVYEISKHT